MTLNQSEKLTDNNQKSERVKARWAILRRALLDSSENETAPLNGNESNNGSSYSMNSFPGFGVLDRTVVLGDTRLTELCEMEDEDGEWDVIKYSYTTHGKTVQFHTREVKKQSKQMKRDALLSHRKHGVDNTGNVRVWDAESTLAGFLLDVIFDEGGALVSGQTVGRSLQDMAAQVVNLSSLKNSLRSMLLTSNEDGEKSCSILELGAGQAGLAGLAMIAASCSGSDNQNRKMKELGLTLSDGHPNCVKSNATCARMMSENCKNNASTIDTRLLLWDSSSKGLENCRFMQESLNLCLASDCVHFQEYHDGLFMTICRTLVVNGIALLCQPKRGLSLENFMALINHVNKGNSVAENPLFEMFLLEDFHPKVSHMHKSLSSDDENGKSYSPNWHQPLLLCLKKIRPYNEETDGSVARQHVQSYNLVMKKVVSTECNRLAPYNPTHSTAQSKALQMLNLKANDVLFDLGCGDGRLLVMALEAALENESQDSSCDSSAGFKCVGIEYDQSLSDSAKVNVQKVLTRYDCVESAAHRVCIRCDDVLNEKERGHIEKAGTSAEQLTLLNDATAVFLYLLPNGLEKIKPLLVEAAKRRRRHLELNEVTSPFRVVSYMFSIPGWTPKSVDTSSKGGCALNYYEDVDLLENMA